ncbi:MAG: site-2 protease family protein [Polyangiaceae bacterium]
MRGSFKLGRFAGIDTFIHWSFGLLVLWSGWSAWRGAGTVAAILLGVGFLLAEFGSVLLHELGHALVARRYGIRTRHIQLTPLGGIASIEALGVSPRAEIAIAIAGPLVNVGIAAILALVMATTGASLFGFLPALMWANVMLAGFNLLPAFPMDGGRVLRAWLSLKKGQRAATRIAVKLGKVVAVGLAVLGVFTNPMLIAIAAFVWFAGMAEEHALRMREVEEMYGPGAATGLGGLLRSLFVGRRGPTPAPRSPGVIDAEYEVRDDADPFGVRPVQRPVEVRPRVYDAVPMEEPSRQGSSWPFRASGPRITRVQYVIVRR